MITVSKLLFHQEPQSVIFSHRMVISFMASVGDINGLSRLRAR
jgi:hypothetical protein